MDGKMNDDDEHMDAGKTSGNNAQGTADGIEEKAKDEQNQNEDKSGGEDEGGDEEEEQNPRIALLKGLWALAKHERVLDILRLQACVGEGDENERASDAKEQEQEQEQTEQPHRVKHHQSVLIYARDALKIWLEVERRMRVRRAI